MGKGTILKIEKDLSIPWFEQIEKTVMLPYSSEQQVYYSIKPPDYVTALVETTDNKFVILKQYRPVVEDFTYELVSGHMEKGETPAEAMKRELREETGCMCDSAVLLDEIIPDTGRLENKLWAFYINNVEINSLPDPSGNEGIEVNLVTKEELKTMIMERKLNHALDLSVITLAIFRNHLRI